MWYPTIKRPADRLANTSFYEKWGDLFWLLSGEDDDQPLTEETANDDVLCLGLLDYPLLLIYPLCFSVCNDKTWHKSLRSFLKFVGTLVLFVKWLLAALITFIAAPLVGILHLLTQPVVPGKTPVWKSFLTNFSTWFTLAFISLAIGFLIQGVNPAIFLQVATPLAVMAPAFLVVGVFMLAITLLYGAIQAVCSTDKTKNDNIILDYFKERIEWAKAYPIPTALIWGVGLSVLITAIIFTVIYSTGGLLPEDPIMSLMGQIFDFMSQGFSAGFPGISAAHCQILSAITFTSAIFFMTEAISRFVTTCFREPGEEITYDDEEERSFLSKDDPAFEMGGKSCKVYNDQLFLTPDNKNISQAEPRTKHNNLILAQAGDFKPSKN